MKFEVAQSHGERKPENQYNSLPVQLMAACARQDGVNATGLLRRSGRTVSI
jgi:hypothetical protein